jgi:hypothetical protein
VQSAADVSGYRCGALRGGRRSTLGFGTLHVSCILLRADERAEEPVHDDEVVAVVVLVGGVVDGVPPCAHDWGQARIEVVMDIGRPERRCEQQQLVREEVHWHDEERKSIRQRLHASAR